MEAANERENDENKSGSKARDGRSEADSSSVGMLDIQSERRKPEDHIKGFDKIITRN